MVRFRQHMPTVRGTCCSGLETMALMGMAMPLEAIRRQIASGIDIFVRLGREQKQTATPSGNCRGYRLCG